MDEDEKLVLKRACKKEFRDLQNFTEKQVEEQIDCSEFASKYIEYPLTINGIKAPENKGIRTDSVFAKCGQLVKVRPCNKKYKNKTYLGILLGEADIGLLVSCDNKTKDLNISRHYNPAIFIPELKDIVYGCGSWWGKINSEEELKEISDDKIANTWYVQLLKSEK